MSVRYFLILTGFFPLFMSAQIQVGETQVPATPVSELKAGPRFIAGLSYRTAGTDTTYTLTFQNADYQHAVDLVLIRFSPSGGTLPRLRAVLLEAIAAGPDYSREITLGSTPVKVSGFEGKRVFVYTADGYTVLTKKQVEKLIDENAR